MDHKDAHRTKVMSDNITKFIDLSIDQIIVHILFTETARRIILKTIQLSETRVSHRVTVVLISYYNIFKIRIQSENIIKILKRFKDFGLKYSTNQN